MISVAELDGGAPPPVLAELHPSGFHPPKSPTSSTTSVVGGEQCELDAGSVVGHENLGSLKQPSGQGTASNSPTHGRGLPVLAVSPPDALY